MEVVKLRYELHCDALHAEESQYAEDISAARAKRVAAEEARRAAAAAAAASAAVEMPVSSSARAQGTQNAQNAPNARGARGGAAQGGDAQQRRLPAVGSHSVSSAGGMSLAESAEAAAAAEARLQSRVAPAPARDSSLSSFTSTPEDAKPPNTPNMAMPAQARPRQISEDGRAGPVIPFSYGGPNALELIQRAMEGQDLLVEGAHPSAAAGLSSRGASQAAASAGAGALKDISLSRSSPFSPPSLPTGTVPLGSPLSGSPWLVERGEGLTKSGGVADVQVSSPKPSRQTVIVQPLGALDSSFDSRASDCAAHCIIPGSFDAEDEIA